MMIDAIDLDVGDHVTTTGLDVQVIAVKRLTPDTPSGVSFRLLPSTEQLDASQVMPVSGYSFREYDRDEKGGDIEWLDEEDFQE